MACQTLTLGAFDQRLVQVSRGSVARDAKPHNRLQGKCLSVSSNIRGANQREDGLGDEKAARSLCWYGSSVSTRRSADGVPPAPRFLGQQRFVGDRRHVHVIGVADSVVC